MSTPRARTSGPGEAARCVYIGPGGFWSPVVALLALASFFGSAQAGPEASAVARAVAEGCRVREASTVGYEFTAITEEFVGRRELGLILTLESGETQPITPERADEILTFSTVCSADGSRSQFIEHYRVTADEWEVEARCTVWGGGHRHFAADVRRAWDDVADLHTRKLYRPDFMVTCSGGPDHKCTMLHVSPIVAKWRTSAAPCADYIGLNLASLGSLSDLLSGWVDRAAAVTAEPVTYEECDGVRLTLYLRPVAGAWSRYRLEFVELDGYAPVAAELEDVVTVEDGTESLRVTRCTWGDYFQIPGGPWIPRTYRLGAFTTDLDGVLRLSRGGGAVIDHETACLADGRLSDKELMRWCPMGACVTVDPDVADRLPAEVATAWARYQEDLWPVAAWHTAPLESLILGMDGPEFTSSQAERKALGSSIREEIKQAVEAME